MNSTTNAERGPRSPGPGTWNRERRSWSPEPGAGTQEGLRSYSPERRTAVVLCGTGAHGAYHAGVLRALHEAGVKIDVLAGQGIGAAGAALAAIDGGARLWEANGIWRSPHVARLYGWTAAARAALLAVAAVAALLLAMVLAAAAGWRVPLWALFAFVGGCAMGAIATAARMRKRMPARRRGRGGWWWRIVGAPVNGDAARHLFSGALWELIRGASTATAPARAAIGRRYSEVLLENLGQPGFRELVLVATDLDARRDVVAALLREGFREEFLAAQADGDRRSDVLDLAGSGRDHALDVIAAAVTPPVVCDPELVTFARDSFWRGETHRLCDRSGSINRLLEEVAAAGVTQAIVVTAVAPAAVPHRLRVPGRDVRSRLGEFLMAAEAAALRDALEMARLRFDALYVVAPAHNPVGPFDLAGAYDESSDRRQDLQELLERASEDAYRQFIEPVVGASGDQLARGDAGPAAADTQPMEFDEDSVRLREFD